MHLSNLSVSLRLLSPAPCLCSSPPHCCCARGLRSGSACSQLLARLLSGCVLGGEQLFQIEAGPPSSFKRQVRRGRGVAETRRFAFQNKRGNCDFFFFFMWMSWSQHWECSQHQLRENDTNDYSNMLFHNMDTWLLEIRKCCEACVIYSFTGNCECLRGLHEFIWWNLLMAKSTQMTEYSIYLRAHGYLIVLVLWYVWVQLWYW